MQVYTTDKPNSIYHEYYWYITGISEHDRYMHGIYLVYTWYILVICRPHQNAWYISTSQLMGLFRTFFYNYILVIYYVHPCDIHSISQGHRIMYNKAHKDIAKI